MVLLTKDGTVRERRIVFVLVVTLVELLISEER